MEFDAARRSCSARTAAPTDPAQEWLAPIKQKFLEARKAGASMADLKQMLLTMHPDTKALAKAFANNILAGFAGESEEVDAANPWGCNQYGHRKGHKGGESKKKESDDVYDFDNMEPDERLQQAIDDLGEVEEEDINWADYDKAQEVKKIFHPDNHKVAQWRKERMINEVGNRVTDALRHLANVNKASRDFRNPNRPTEDDVARAEEAFGKAVHEWRRFHRARLEVQGWDKKAIDGYLSRWPEYMETANADEVDAAKPTGCNQYKHQPGCNMGLPSLPSSMEEVDVFPGLEPYGIPGGRVYIRRKLKGKFPIKGRMKNKKKAIGRFKKVLTPPYSVSKPYQVIDKNGDIHTRIDIIKTENGVTRQLVVQTSGDYAGGIVTYIDDISNPRKQKRTAGGSVIR